MYSMRPRPAAAGRTLASLRPGSLLVANAPPPTAFPGRVVFLLPCASGCLFLLGWEFTRKEPFMLGVDERVSGRQNNNKNGKASGVKGPRARGSGSSRNRSGFLVPRPTDSPPSVASSRGGEVANRRRNERAIANRSRGGKKTGRPCSSRSTSSTSSSNRSRSSGRRRRKSSSTDVRESQYSGSSISSRSRSRSRSRISRSRSRSSRSSRSRGCRSSSSSGGGDEDMKTHLTVDDITSMDNCGESTDGGRGGGRSRNGKRESYHTQDTFARNDDHDHGRKRESSRDTAKLYRRRCSNSSQSRSRHGRKGAPTLCWPEKGAQGPASSTHDENHDNADESPGSPGHRRNGARSTNEDRKARGSETTATPSPRDHPSGFGGATAGEPLLDGVSEGVMGWLTEPAVNDWRRQHSITSSSATTLSPRQGSTRPSLEVVCHTDHGSEIDGLATDCTDRSNGCDGDGTSSHGRRKSSRARKGHSPHRNARSNCTRNKEVSRSGNSVDQRRLRHESPGRG